MLQAKEWIRNAQENRAKTAEAIRAIQIAYGETYLTEYSREDYDSYGKQAGRGERADSRRVDLQNSGRGNNLIQEGPGDNQAKRSLHIQQEFSSAKTSLNQVAALFKNKNFDPGDINIDIGGGTFNATTEYLADKYGTDIVSIRISENIKNKKIRFC